MEECYSISDTDTQKAVQYSSTYEINEIVALDGRPFSPAKQDNLERLPTQSIYVFTTDEITNMFDEFA